MRHGALTVVALALSACAGAAQAGLEICNRTGQPQSVAIGFKDGADWTSTGWWSVAPDACATVVEGDLSRRYYYYHASNAAGLFRGQDYVFCTLPTAFEIAGDQDCRARGYEATEFREIDTGATARHFRLTLTATEPGAGPRPSAEGPGGGRAVAAVAPPRGPDDRIGGIARFSGRVLSTDAPPGKHGTPFRTAALFQGCELENKRAFCGFHADGVKLRSFYRGPTPDEMLIELERLPVNLPVEVEGDRVEKKGLQSAVVLRKVVPRPGTDPRADLREAIQGDWVETGDPMAELTITGSEAFERYDGAFRAVRFLRLAETCAGLDAPGPVLIQSPPAGGQAICYRILRADGRRLDLDPVGARGAPVRYQRGR